MSVQTERDGWTRGKDEFIRLPAEIEELGFSRRLGGSLNQIEVIKPHPLNYLSVHANISLIFKMLYFSFSNEDHVQTNLLYITAFAGTMNGAPRKICHMIHFS